MPLKDFEKLGEVESEYILEKEYRVRYCGKKYLAKLCIIGTESFCEKEVDRLVNYYNNSALKKNIAKSSVRPIDNALIEKEAEIVIKNHEIETLKRKLETNERESSEKINNLTIEIEKLKREKGNYFYLNFLFFLSLKFFLIISLKYSIESIRQNCIKIFSENYTPETSR